MYYLNYDRVGITNHLLMMKGENVSCHVKCYKKLWGGESQMKGCEKDCRMRMCWFLRCSYTQLVVCVSSMV